MPSKNILILGGTGPTGISTVRTALDHGHLVTVYARSPEKLPEELRNHASLTIIKGKLSDTKLLYGSLPVTDSIISLLGPNTMRHSAPFFTDFYSGLLAHLRTTSDGQRPRLLALSTISVSDTNDAFSLTAWLLVTVVWLVAYGAYKDFTGTAETFRKEGEDLDWILFRVAILGAGQGKGGKAGWVGKGGWKIKTNMDDIAEWAVTEAEVEKSQWVGKMPALF